MKSLNQPPYLPLHLRTLVFVACIALSPSGLLAQEEKKPEPKLEASNELAEIKTEAGRLVVRVTDGLNNPTSVVVQPETGLIFVADSGNGQVVRVLDGKVDPVITDFPKEALGTTPPVNIGPLPSIFNKDNLLVGTGDSLRAKTAFGIMCLRQRL
ncbi:MAG: hypothetical protein U0930_09790 [Pirellulales bacterium]